jgi:hypothetical protein
MRIIYEQNNYRIVERADEFADLEDLKGEMFTQKMHPDIDAEKLAEEERDFEELVNREGVYGYALERWNAEVNHGWEHVDSCWGFVGSYNESEERFKHYIVAELKNQIPNEGKE